MNPEKLSQKPLYPVADHRVADFPADRKPNPEILRPLRSRQHKKDKALGMIAPPPLVACEKLRTANQTAGLGEA